MAPRPHRKRKKAARGRMLRPKATILSDAALVPPEQLIDPPPNQFTHEVLQSQPYFLESAKGVAAGEFPAGTRVVLMVYEGGDSCRVVDGQGLYVTTAHSGLRRL